ncbi:hypothetical protein MFIFM68171_06002 [Madurella fahalii]|uniref:Uncharacterized protein n=1 Tax=Madurella fahalii TaxID=1157608 RepID=A0ABQ0GDI2_9PEZI
MAKTTTAKALGPLERGIVLLSDVDDGYLTWFQYLDTGCVDFSQKGAWAKGSFILTSWSGNNVVGMQRNFENLGPKYDVRLNEGLLGTRA